LGFYEILVCWSIRADQDQAYIGARAASTRQFEKELEIAVILPAYNADQNSCK